MTARNVATGLAALAVGALIAGCSASTSAPPAAHHRTASATTATHWWSSTDYCAILRQTMRAGHSVLPGATADDPQLLAATKAFVSDLTASAPTEVRAQWRVLGPALSELVESGGKLTAVSGVNTRLVSAAASTVAADARTRCHVDLGA